MENVIVILVCGLVFFVIVFILLNINVSRLQKQLLQEEKNYTTLEKSRNQCLKHAILWKKIALGYAYEELKLDLPPRVTLATYLGEIDDTDFHVFDRLWDHEQDKRRKANRIVRPIGT